MKVISTLLSQAGTYRDYFNFKMEPLITPSFPEITVTPGYQYNPTTQQVDVFPVFNIPELTTTKASESITINN
jgi:hypothetical protein